MPRELIKSHRNQEAFIASLCWISDRHRRWGVGMNCVDHDAWIVCEYVPPHKNKGGGSLVTAGIEYKHVGADPGIDVGLQAMIRLYSHSKTAWTRYGTPFFRVWYDTANPDWFRVEPLNGAAQHYGFTENRILTEKEYSGLLHRLRAMVGQGS